MTKTIPLSNFHSAPSVEVTGDQQELFRVTDKAVKVGRSSPIFMGFLGRFPVFFLVFRKSMVVFFGWFTCFFCFSPLVFLSCFGSPRLRSTMVLWKICRYAFAKSGLEHLGHLTFHLWVKFYVKQIAGGVHCQVRLQFMPVLKERTSHPPWAKDAEKYEPRGR